jgi:hypothetical protein
MASLTIGRGKTQVAAEPVVDDIAAAVELHGEF